MGSRACSLAALVAAAAFWLLGGTQHERPVLTGEAPERLRALEADAASHENDAEATRVLALAVRRTAILGELVALGVVDSGKSPDESLVAYRNATREARVMLQ